MNTNVTSFNDLIFNDQKEDGWRGRDFDFGVQAKVSFSNGYSASVIRGPHSYGGREGLYELAIIGPDGHLDYTTPITSDVEGHLTESAVSDLLAQISALPDKRMK